MSSIVKPRTDTFVMGKRQWKSSMFILLLPVLLCVLHACSSDDNPSDSGNPLVESFKAEIYHNGSLVATLDSAIAELTDPQTYAYIEVNGGNDDLDFQISFWCKSNAGIHGMVPASLDPTNYGEPHIDLYQSNSPLLTGYIYSNENHVCDCPRAESCAGCSVRGTGSGTITAIDSTRVAGNFSGKNDSNGWEVRNCSFNLKLK